MNKGKLYLTTTLPYVNAEPHIGHALEYVQADVVARYKRLLGYEVFFNTGTDEHGQKVWLKAQEAGEEPQTYADRFVLTFRELVKILGLDWDNPNFNFIRTTDEHHLSAAQEFWLRCLANGDIYKKNYEVKYCVGCELEKTDSELVDGKCPIHPNLAIEIIKEENYFFRFSRFAEALTNFYEANPDFVKPAGRFNEIKSFVAHGLEDFSVSRLKSKMPWGVPVPDDPDQVMYVWFDALSNYVTALGWPENEKKFNDWWPAIQFAGKDNIRQQSAMWQAMLLSAGLPPSKQIFIHGFLTIDGQKISKSLGNVIRPAEVVERYGIDVLRYYLTREVSPVEDGDFSWEKLKDSYNGSLANGLGNLTSRIIKMYQSYEVPEPKDLISASKWLSDDFFREYCEALDNFEFGKAMEFIWTQIKEADLYIANTKPFSLYKTEPKEARKHVSYLVSALWRIAVALEPFMPSTAQKIQTAIKTKELSEPLFLRKE